LTIIVETSRRQGIVKVTLARVGSRSDSVGESLGVDRENLAVVGENLRRKTRFPSKKRDFQTKNTIFTRKTRFSSEKRVSTADERDFHPKNVIVRRKTRFSREKRVSRADERDFQRKKRDCQAKNAIFRRKT